MALVAAPPLPRRLPPPRRLPSGPVAAARGNATEVGLVAALVVHECAAVPRPGDGAAPCIVKSKSTKWQPSLVRARDYEAWALCFTQNILVCVACRAACGQPGVSITQSKEL